MHRRRSSSSSSSSISTTIALGAAALALVAAAGAGAGAASGPEAAAAREARGELSVTVRVVGSCRTTFADRLVWQDCGAGAPYPVTEEEAPRAPAALRVTPAAGTRYLTVTY